MQSPRLPLKTVRVEQLALQTGKVVNEAGRRPVVVRDGKKPAPILRPLADDDAADTLLQAPPSAPPSAPPGAAGPKARASRWPPPADS